MKLKYYFLLVILALFTSCSNELGMQDNLNDSKILLSSDEYKIGRASCRERV